MTCEEARETLMSVPSGAFGELEHLQTCADCRAFAEELRAADTAMVAHVEACAGSGDFDATWARARAEAGSASARARRRWFGRGTVLGLVALAAGILLLVGPPTPPEILPGSPEPVTEAPVAAAPVAAAPVAATPIAPPVVVPEPPVGSEPSATPPRPPPIRPPASLPPRTVRPATEPPPVAAAPVSSGRTLTIEVEPGLSGAGVLTCGTNRIRAVRAGDVLRFDAVPTEVCTLEVGGFRGPLPNGTRFWLGATGLRAR